YFNYAITGLFDALLWPFRTLPPIWGLAFVSVLAGIVMLFIFKLTSRQEKIRAAKDLIKGYLLQIRLYRDDLPLMFAAQKGILKANLTYLKYSVVPIAFIIVPVVLIMIQLNLRYGAAPMEPRHTFVVKAVFDGRVPEDVALSGGDSFTVETPPVRVERLREASWRVRANGQSNGTLTITANGGEVTKKVVVGAGPVQRIPTRRASGLYDQLMFPGEAPIESASGVKSIEVIYPPPQLYILGIAFSWIIVFFALSVTGGFALKGLLKVEV
ncbi:MAG: hypothetical protein JSW52_02980, partial [Candidatus Coatesbacteria bacterium]